LTRSLPSDAQLSYRRATAYRESSNFLGFACALILVVHVVDVVHAGGPNWPALAIRIVWAAIALGEAVLLRRASHKTLRIGAGVLIFGSAVMDLLIVQVTGRSGSPLLAYTFVLAMTLPLMVFELFWVGMAAAVFLLGGTWAMMAVDHVPPVILMAFFHAGSGALLTGGLLARAQIRTRHAEEARHVALDEAFRENAERTAELHTAQRQLVRTAHSSGMAEIAVGVLHNVGNVLTSVNVSAEELHRLTQSSALGGFLQANDLLTSQEGQLPAFFSTDPRATHLPRYYRGVAEALTRDMDRAQAESLRLLEKTRLIRDTLRALQDYATNRSDEVLRESFKASEIINEAIEIQQANLDGHRIVLRRQLDENLPPLVSDRRTVLHVLVHLVKNAVQAMSSTPEGSRILTVAVRAEGWDEIEFRVSDTGVGIPPENLDRIFGFGFTTRPDGNGLGLHSCAVDARRLDGRIRVQSQGLGTGASFSLALPVNADRGASS
jgi:signal transduction histidine kinase